MIPQRLSPRLTVEVIQAWLIEHLAHELGLPPDALDPQEPFDAFGISSREAVVLSGDLEEWLGRRLSPTLLWEHQTIADLARHLADSDAQALPGISPIAHTGALSLSYAQERLWFLERFAHGAPLYNIGDVAFRLSGTLDRSALARSLGEIVHRHESLRTTFDAAAGQPVQIIHPPQPFDLSWVDLSGIEPEQREAEAQRVLVEEVRRPFDLVHGPLFRAVLVRLAQDEHLLALPMHHIISDGWSVSVLLRELQTLYAAFVRGEPSPLPALPIQYADYAAWQRTWLQGDLLQAQLAYWRGQLAGSPELLALPTDRPRPAVQTHRGRRVPFTAPAELLAGLQALSQEEGATLFMTLLAAFQTLLFRYTGQADVPVGTPIANRHHGAVRDLIGFFVNTLVLRGDLSGNPTFRALLGRVRQTALAAYEHQDVPFEKLVAELHPTRDLSRAPLFQVMLALQNVPLAGLRLPELTVQPVELEPGTTKFDLTLSVGEGPAGLAGWLAYNSDLFDEATIARMVGHFGTLLTGIVADPDMRVGDLPLLTAAEQTQLAAWNATAAPYPADRCIHELVAAQAAATPDSIAVESEGQTLTYAELDRRANQLAHHLQHRGVGPETIVGLCVERSPKMIVGVLGILKAGGAYLPLDPAYPPERLAFMLEDAGVTVLLTDGRMKAEGGRMKDEDGSFILHPSSFILLDADWPLIAQEPTSKPASAVTADNLAYVIYTSGSTGTPKGVLIQHRGLCNLVTAQMAAFEISATSRVLQFASLSFDAAASEIFTALASGATLVLAPQATLAAPDRLAALLAEQAITVVTLPPSLLRLLPRTALPALRTVVSAGEACSWDVVAAWAPGRRFVNAYGPTEATIGPICGVVEARADAAGPVPIGRPIANMQVHVLDAAGQPVPVGVTGELCLSGVGLARGYLNRPELTVERFIPAPFSSGRSPTEPLLPRLYRTGDLARYRPDGTLECLGRRDGQVKVRGYRIELGEIEAVLAQQPGVQAAAVAAHGAGADARLVAYVVPTGAETPAADVLRRGLAAKLPDYMLPAAFVTLAALPRTPSGKLDRTALPAPEGARPALSTAYVAPVTPLERALAQVWAEVLGLPQVGRHDNFFDLGGDSIRGAICINRLEQTLGQPVYVVALFEAPTVAQLAAYLTQHYPEAVARTWGAEWLPAAPIAAPRVTAAEVAQLRALIPALPSARPDLSGPNPPAVFVLAPPRSGTTLLRAMLGGHPQLFAPPELELLSFNTLAERAAALSGRFAFWREGVVRALMELHHCSADAAQALMAEREARGLSVKAFYRELQGWLGDRRLVDKTPAYALDRAILDRMESDFQDARYVYLLRQPQAVVRSFAEARLEQVFFRYAREFDRRTLAELIWLVSHENIQAFLAGIPPERQCWVRFEELVRQPEAVMRDLCAFLGLPFAPAMLEPYAQDRMTDGIHPLAKMLGDVKFHQHAGIDAAVADRGPGEAAELGEPTWALAESLGYARPTEAVSSLTSVAGLPPLRPVPREGDLPLSFGQQRLWFLDRLAPGSPFYNMPAAVRLTGALDVAAFARALNEIVRRHEALRTSFPTVGGQPVQRIAAPAAVALPVTDLSAQPAAEREAAVYRLATAEAEQPFDLAAGPLLRVGLLRLADQEHVLLLTLHHIVADGWSVGVFIRELAALYAAFAAARSSPLPELALQYADYAVWQRAWLQGEALAEQLAYWRAQLADSPPVLALPLDRPRPRVQTYHGANYAFTLSAALTEQLKALGRQEGATLFMTLLAAFQALLQRYTDQARIAVGAPIANRTRAELEGLIGFFVNTLVLCTDLAGNPTFRELLGRVRAVALGAYRHQDLPFELLVEALQPERDMSHSPLFQVAFILQNAPIGALALTGLTVERMDAPGRIAKFDLTLTLTEAADGLAGILEYNTDLFDAGTIARMAGHLQTLLAGIAADPDGRLADLPLLTEAERRQLLVEWNATDAPYPADRCIHELFEEVAAQTPDAPAVVFEGQTLTYAELDHRANQLAHHLQRRGVGPETIVGLCVERSPEMIVGLLGILKAGAAYLPLDPSYPPARLAFMLADAGVTVLLTDEHPSSFILHPSSFIPHPSSFILLDADWPLIAQEPATAPPCAATPDNLAYVIYTSGSTGQPKGVQVEHRGLCNIVSAQRSFLGIGRGDRLWLFCSLSFDASLFEILLALWQGATLYLPTREDLLPGPNPIRFLREHAITAALIIPSALAAMPVADLPLLHTLMVGGEACPAELVAHWAPGRRFFNLYGPTETTIWATGAQCVADGRLPPIGRPIANTQVYVLDATGQPAPIGVPGELYIGGVGVARGYLNRKDEGGRMKDERAVGSSSFILHPSSLLYRTGDLVRYRPDGNLEYLGRLDHQVKVRGFRIELEEIETVLGQHPSVCEAVVAAYDGPAGKRLVAYIVPTADPPPAVGELRHFLTARLPDYMIPSAFLMLKQLPLAPSGKLDRGALPAPAGDRPDLAQSYVAPRTPVEQTLAAIWAELLGVAQVGVHDNFFELGGHSLLATQAISRVRDALTVELPLQLLFQEPTVAGLAEFVERLSSAGRQPITPARGDDTARETGEL